MEINDIDIIIEVLDGNTDKFAILIDKYKNKIFKIVSMHVLINWLTVISIRTCKDFWRKKYAQKDMPMSSFSEETEQTIEQGIDYRTPEDNILGEEKYKMLMKAMEYLKPVERTIISMMYAEERSVAEIASITGMTESNVKVTAFRARKKLSEILNTMM